MPPSTPAVAGRCSPCLTGAHVVHCNNSAQLTTALLRLLKFVVPRSPLVFSELQAHGFFRAVLLTARCTVPHGSDVPGLCKDAADLLYAFHNVEEAAEGASAPSYLDPLLPPSMVTVLRAKVGWHAL